MRLAEHKDLIAKKKATSIRKANEIVRELKKQQSRGNTSSINRQINPPEKQQKPAFGDELKAVAPDEVCKLLLQAGWEDDQLQELAKLIGEYLQKKRTAKLAMPGISNAVPNSPAPTVRRPVA
jgi:hypothetical protein